MYSLEQKRLNLWRVGEEDGVWKTLDGVAQSTKLAERVPVPNLYLRSTAGLCRGSKVQSPLLRYRTPK